MFNNFKKIGDIVFDYVIISLLLTISLLLLIPFIPVYIGVNYYFSKSTVDRSLKDIFICIKNNFGIICKFTVLELILLVFSIGNILYFNTGSRSNDLITLLSYVFLIFGVIFFVNSSVIINNMNVNLKQLIFNCVTFIFGKWYVSIILIVLTVGSVIGLLYFPYIVPFALYFIGVINQKTNGPIFDILKARQLKTTVNEMKEQENHDDYYDK